MWTTTDSVVSADGTRIVFHTLGDGPPLVVLHGALVTTELYLPLAELLAAEYRVVVVGRRDYAPSGNGTRPSVFARHVEDLAAVLERQDGPSFVFGHSAGGLVTLEALAAGIPNIRRFALYEAPLAFAGGPLRTTLDRARELVADNHPADAVVEFFRAILDPPAPESILRALGAAMAARAPGLIADLECLAVMDPDLNRWSATATPALLLAGSASDGYGQESMEKLDAALPDSRFTLLAGLTHSPDDFAPVATALREFFH
ncbi:alpha/beta fold hydrolase [Nocardia sp. NBC_01327]|uniref:alpha/beta fold hydrolase n=1 Tax=Nocardia sp. NBC_01327 TaxID=2903593 RepID=UPI002E10F714|nr:alpha/beta hydrolase [Nocardia sp. NBC_01327]